MNTARCSGFLSRLKASSPNLCRSVSRSVDLGGATFGRKNVKMAMSSHTMMALCPARVEASAWSALTSQQPAIHPAVPRARTGPNCRLGSLNEASVTVVTMLQVGERKNASS